MAGNYDKDYQIVQTTGRRLNDPKFALSGGFSLSASADSQIDEFIDGLVSYSKPTRSVQQHVIVNRFSAPGGPETNGDPLGGPGLDFEHAEISPYNALPYRNLKVRQFGEGGGLRGFLSEAEERFGLTGAADASGYSGDPTYHKVNANRRRRYEWAFATSSYTTLGDVTIGETKDNGFISRPIPQSDLQYSWITASGGQGVFGYATASGDITFATGTNTLLSASLYLFGGGPGLTGSRARYNQPQDVNILIYEDMDLTSSTLLADTYVRMATDAIGHNVIFERDGFEVQLVILFREDAAISGDVDFPRATNVSGTLHGLFDLYMEGAGLSSVAAADFHIAEAGPHFFNALFTKRGYRGGWSSWKQLRQTDHPLKKAQRRSNLYIVSEASREEKKYLINGGSFSFDRALKNKLFTEPPIDSSNRQIHHFIDTTETPNGNYTLFRYSFGNERDFFANPGLDDITTRPNIETKFEQLVDKYQDRDLVNRFRALEYTKRIWPQRKNEGLERTTNRPKFSFPWREKKADRSVLTGSTIREYFTTNQIGGVHRSVWPVDYPVGLPEGTFETDSMTGSNPIDYFASGGFGIGDLVNKYSTYHNGNPGDVIASALYARPSVVFFDQETSTGAGRYKIGGFSYNEPTLKSTSEEDTRPPMKNSYGGWSDPFRKVIRDGSLFPEFRISREIDFYFGQVKGGLASNTDNGPFSKNDKFLSITGSSIRDSATGSFFDAFVDSIDNDEGFYLLSRNKEEAPTSTGKAFLSLSAVKKFLPYEGFYPAQRTRELATIFLESTVESGQLVIGGADSNYRTALQPFFAPGILFNSIKAQYSVDFPVKTSSFEVCDLRATPEPYFDDDFHQTENSGLVHTGSWHRVPFEALAAPSTFFGARRVFDIEVHPSSAINSTCSWDGTVDEKYLLAMNNFLTEVPRFFIGNDRLTRVTSQPLSSIRFDSEGVEEYLMDVVMTSVSERNTVSSFYNLFNNGLAYTDYRSDYSIQDFNAASGFPRASAFNSPVNLIATRDLVRGELYGPPSRHIVVNGFTGDYSGSAGYSPFTPPTFGGEALVRLRFRPFKEKGGVYSIQEVVENLTASYSRAGWGSISNSNSALSQGSLSFRDYIVTGTSGENAMQVSSSLNLFGVREVLSTEFDPNGRRDRVKEKDSNISYVWTIGPKWETPNLKYNGASFSSEQRDTYPSNATGVVGIGPWLSSYNLSGAMNESLKIKVRYPSPDEMKLQGDPSTTGSLAEVFGFPSDHVKIGEIAEKNTVSELVVCIPYIDSDRGKEFFPPSEKEIQADPEFREDFYKRFVFPPQYDTRFRAKPYLFYWFEVTHDFSRDDMAKMWNNTAPALLDQAEFVEDKVEVRASLAEVENLRWMIFKVKQRARTNYFNLVEESVRDRRYINEFEIGVLRDAEKTFSYNWPYDYFTMIEWGKIDMKIILEGEDE